MASAPAIAEAFTLLQAGDAAAALEASQRVVQSHPSSARAHLAAGIALRLLGRLAESQASLERAAALDPRDYAVAYEAAVVFQLRGDPVQALAQFHRAAALRPDFFAAHFSAGVLQFERKEWASAIASFRAALAIDAANVEALLNLGQALCEHGDEDEGESAIARAIALDPRHAAGRHAMGWALHRRKRTAEALAHFQAAATANPREPDWQLSVAKALGDLGRHAEAEEAYVRALSADPDHFLTLRSFGRYSASRGNFARAAKLFTEALRRCPADEELPMFLAQVELLLGRWDAAWTAYAKRDTRLQFEHTLEALGSRYVVPGMAVLAGREVSLVAEQGLGDNLFFLRFAPALKAAGTRLRFAGEPRLHPLLARSGLFESFDANAVSQPSAGWLPIMVGDLPSVVAGNGQSYLPPLPLPPDAARVAKWRSALESAGPRPWIGVTWRAGTPSAQVAHALYKTVPIDGLFAALRPLGGTVIALQRRCEPRELDEARRALGAPVHDFSGANDDLEDALALVSLLDRHVGVSNTNTHLAAAAGAAGDVLVAFPPEWRWRIEGDSPWFPGFRVHRQSLDGDWGKALEGLQKKGAEHIFTA
jgi:tetratricopeptide (TPR) repeat protein